MNSYFHRLKRLRRLVGCGAVAVAGFFTGASLARAQHFSPHFDVGVQAGDDVGLDNGYGRFGTFLPWLETDSGLLVFSDTQVLVFHQDSEVISANLGGGARYYDVTMDRVFGAYAYYDYRDRELAQYNQVGFGAETLGHVFDARVNVNLPTDTQNTFVATDIFTTPIFGGPAGQNIVVGADRFEQALRVVDVEGGALLLDHGAVQVRGYAGGYGLFGDDVDGEWGVRARVEARVAEQVWASGYVQDDDLFGTTAGVNVVWRYGCGREKYDCGCLARRMYDPVQRRHHVAVRDVNIDVLATDGGAPITVLHVDSSAAPGGTGGVNDPLTLLADASNQPQDIVFVHGGSVFNGEAMVISTDGQRFLGEGFAHTFVSDQGTFLLPNVNPAGAAPEILGAPANAVTIAADNVEVANFTITGAGASGIFGDGVSGFNVNHNTVTQSGAAGIRFDNNAGTGTIALNIASNNNDAGIWIGGDLTGDITNNTTSDNVANVEGGHGIAVTGTLDGNVLNNVASSNAGHGIILNEDINGDIEGNIAQENGLDGIVVIQNVNGDIRDNVASNNTNNGIRVLDNVEGVIQGNTLNDNGNGLYVDDDVTGLIAQNTAIGNNDHGLHIGGDLLGVATLNVTNENGLDGFRIDGELGPLPGDTLGLFQLNESSNNGGNGFHFGGRVVALVSTNGAVNNGENGFLFEDEIIGQLFNNFADNNGFAGFRIEGNVTALGGPAAITTNRANANGTAQIDNGFIVVGNILGSVSFNETNENSGNGFQANDMIGGFLDNEASDNTFNGIVLGELTGDFLLNTASFNVLGNGATIDNVDGNLQSNFTSQNGVDGIYVLGDVNSVLSNTANLNTDDGIDIDGTINGSAALNTFIGNGDQGLEN